MIFTIIRVIICIAAAAGFGFFAFPLTVNVINIGNISGMAVCVWVFLIACKPIHRAIRGLCAHLFVTKALYYTVNTLFTAFVIYGIIVSAFMVIGMNQAPPVNSTAVVLGAQVMPAGHPSTMLRGRIEAAENILRKTQTPRRCCRAEREKGNPSARLSVCMII